MSSNNFTASLELILQNKNVLKIWLVSKSIRKDVKKFGTDWKVSVFGDFLVGIFPHSDWILRDTEYISVFGPNMENTDQKNSEYGHFSGSEIWIEKEDISMLDLLKLNNSGLPEGMYGYENF